MKILLLVIVTAAFLFACGSEQPTGSALNKGVVIRDNVGMNLAKYLKAHLKNHGKTETRKHLIRYHNVFREGVLGGALVQAAAAGDKKVVEILLTVKLPPPIKSSILAKEKNPEVDALVAAIEGGKSRKITKILLHTFSDAVLGGALIKAAAAGDKKMLEVLIRANAPLKEEDHDSEKSFGREALIAAIEGGKSRKIIKILLHAGASPSSSSPLYSEDEDVLHNPMEVAVRQGRRKVVQDFLKFDRGENIRTVGLIVAAKTGNWEIGKDIIADGGTVTEHFIKLKDKDQDWVKRLLNMMPSIPPELGLD